MMLQEQHVTPDRHAILTVRSRQCKSYLKTLHPYL